MGDLFIQSLSQLLSFLHTSWSLSFIFLSILLLSLFCLCSVWSPELLLLFRPYTQGKTFPSNIATCERSEETIHGTTW